MRRTLTILTALAIGILSLAALPQTSTVRAQTSEPLALYKSFMPLVVGPASSQSPAEQTIAIEILAIVNSERAAAGCAPLTLDERLSTAAQNHSADMALNNYFAHNSLDGTTPAQRAARAGYPSGMIGENIAAGYTTPAEVMEGWMESPGHRDNILRCSYSQIGIGHAYEEGDTYPGPYGYGHYWAQVFGIP